MPAKNVGLGPSREAFGADVPRRPHPGGVDRVDGVIARGIDQDIDFFAGVRHRVFVCGSTFARPFGVEAQDKNAKRNDKENPRVKVGSEWRMRIDSGKIQADQERQEGRSQCRCKAQPDRCRACRQHENQGGCVIR
ncbi:MAG: hypothetical protein H7251_10055 [Acetobacteraceae bacterium]|nr:hypothetical protein [Acetobacteraceae bacterium]